MHPLILIEPDEKRRENYLDTYIKTHKISQNYVTKLRPEKKQIRIDQIRILKKQLVHVQTKPQLFVLENADSATQEAQNALLKTLEEHPPLVHIFLIVSSVQALLPTIRSRSRIVRLNQKSDYHENTHNNEIYKLLDTAKKTNTPTFFSEKILRVQSSEEALRIIDSCISYLRSQLAHDTIKAADLLKRMLESRSYIARNNLNPQVSLDMLFFEIFRTYHT